MYHTVVIGGGCLGAAAAISIQRKLNSEGNGEKVCLLEKAVLCAAESSRHSGIVRSANADPDASMMASISTEMWKNLKKHWGIDMELDEFGAIWIAKKNSDGENPAWNELSHRMKKIDLVFEEIKPSDALKKCGTTLITDKNESYYYEPDAFQLDPSILRSVLYDAIDENGVELTADQYSTMFSDIEVASRKYANFYNEVEIKRENYQTVDEYLIAKANAFNQAFNEGLNDDLEVSRLIYKVKIAEFKDGISAQITKHTDTDTVLVNDQPIYQYTGDQTDSSVNGNAIANVWYVIKPDGQSLNPDETDIAGPLITELDVISENVTDSTLVFDSGDTEKIIRLRWRLQDQSGVAFVSAFGNSKILLARTDGGSGGTKSWELDPLQSERVSGDSTDGYYEKDIDLMATEHPSGEFSISLRQIADLEGNITTMEIEEGYALTIINNSN